MRIVQPGFVIEDKLDGDRILENIERYGRTCYKSEAKISETSSRGFVRKIIASGHESVIEHEKVTVRIICDRGVSHEIVRHRIASYSQESTRYCDYARAGEITVIKPCFLSEETELFWMWKSAMVGAEHFYNTLRGMGCSPQEARTVLPNSLKTEIVCTMNLREWRHFFRLRTSPAAHPQMREISIPLLWEFQRLIPVIFDDIEVPA
jgi:thymidylate synthase (FAD)